MYRAQLSAKNMVVLIDGLHAVATHAHQINGDSNLRSKLQELGSMTQMQDPPLLRLENESYQTCLTLLQNLILDRPVSYDEVEVEAYFVDLCKEVLQVYLNMTQSWQQSTEPAIVCVHRKPHWLIPLDSVKRRELAARAPLAVSTLQAICGLGDSSFGKNLAQIFPLVAGLISCEHGSSEVQVALSDMLTSAVGPVLLQSC